MTTIREAPVGPYLLELATELGFMEVHQIHRDDGSSPLFYARWKGAPVGITEVTGIGGHLDVAFYQGHTGKAMAKSCLNGHNNGYYCIKQGLVVIIMTIVTVE